jgi:hypothetical protein
MTTKAHQFRQETQMSDTPTAARSDARNADDDRRDGDRPRLGAAWMALLWVVVVALAFFPYPWWW